MPDATNTSRTGHNGIITTIGEGSPLADVWIAYSGAAFSNAWPAANRALYMPFQTETFVTVYQIVTYNAATVAGNVDVGIYDAAGNRLINKGSTAMSGASVVQKFDITDTTLAPGNYYMAMASDSATATFFCAFVNTVVIEFLGMKQQATAFALPSTATFALPASQMVPVVSLATRATI